MFNSYLSQTTKGFKKAKLSDWLSCYSKKINKPPINTAVLPSGGPIDIDSIQVAEPINVDSILVVRPVARGSRCYNGVIPLNKRTLNENLEWLFRYACQDLPISGFVVKPVGLSHHANIYNMNCTGDGIPRRHRHHPDMCYVMCQLLWTKRSTKLKKMVTNRGSLFKAVARCLLVPALSEEDAEVMDKFSRTNDHHLNDNGVVLKAKVKALLDFHCTTRVGKSF